MSETTNPPVESPAIPDEPVVVVAAIEAPSVEPSVKAKGWHTLKLELRRLIVIGGSAVIVLAVILSVFAYAVSNLAISKKPTELARQQDAAIAAAGFAFSEAFEQFRLKANPALASAVKLTFTVFRSADRIMEENAAATASGEADETAKELIAALSSPEIVTIFDEYANGKNRYYSNYGDTELLRKMPLEAFYLFGHAKEISAKTQSMHQSLSEQLYDIEDEDMCSALTKLSLVGMNSFLSGFFKSFGIEVISDDPIADAQEAETEDDPAASLLWKCLTMAPTEFGSEIAGNPLPEFEEYAFSYEIRLGNRAITVSDKTGALLNKLRSNKSKDLSEALKNNRTDETSLVETYSALILAVDEIEQTNYWDTFEQLVPESFVAEFADYWNVFSEIVQMVNATGFVNAADLFGAKLFDTPKATNANVQMTMQGWNFVWAVSYDSKAFQKNYQNLIRLLK